MLLKHYNKEEILLQEFDGNWKGGSCGRICIHEKYFKELNGYDESFYPTGYQDLDLINRAKLLGVKCIKPEYSKKVRYIKNSMTEKTENTEIKDFSFQSLSNKRKSMSNLKKGIYRVNEKGQERFKGVLNFEKEITI